MIFQSVSFKPDLYLSHGSIYASHAAFVLGKKHIALEDSGNMEQIRLYRPFTHKILTPHVLPEDLGPKQIRYNGNHEIAYLHPHYFTPNEKIYGDLKLPENTPYAILRFVSWNATHDLGQNGLTPAEKERCVQLLAKKMKVFISSENDLPPEMQKFIMPVSPDKFHDVLSCATLVISEGATVASESGVLGTPAIYINPIRRSYCEELQEYGLVYNINDYSFSKLESTIDEILNQDNQEFNSRRDLFLSDKIDVTAFVHKYITQRCT